MRALASRIRRRSRLSTSTTSPTSRTAVSKRVMSVSSSTSPRSVITPRLARIPMPDREVTEAQREGDADAIGESVVPAVCAGPAPDVWTAEPTREAKPTVARFAAAPTARTRAGVEEEGCECDDCGAGGGCRELEEPGHWGIPPLEVCRSARSNVPRTGGYACPSMITSGTATHHAGFRFRRPDSKLSGSVPWSRVIPAPSSFGAARPALLGSHLDAWRRAIRGEDLAAQRHALVADERAHTGDELLRLLLRPAAEGTLVQLWVPSNSTVMLNMS